MRINNNLMAMNTYRQLNAASTKGARSMEKLSSGLRINKAGDDAAGLSISEKMRGQIRGLTQASRNAQDGISLIQTAEGALNETHAILQRMRELVVQAGNGTNDSEDLAAIQKEIRALIEELGGTATEAGKTVEVNVETTAGAIEVDATGYEGDNATWVLTATYDDEQDVFVYAIDGNPVSETDGEITYNGVTITLPDSPADNDQWEIELVVTDVSASGSKGISDRTQFNGKALLDGSLTDMKLQIGANGGQQVSLTIGDMSASGLGVDGLDVTDFVNTSFDTQLAKVDTAIGKVSAQRSQLGALQNRLEHTINNVDNAAENLSAAESRIRDVDMAKEMMEFTKNNILQQAATAMLAQANQAPQGVLQLLR